MNVHSNIIHNSQKVQRTQMSTNWQMDEQTVVHPYKKILFSHKNKVLLYIYDMDKPRNMLSE